MRIKIFCTAFLLLMLNTVVLFAQTDPGRPCGGTDPDATCPLDTWVLVLAFVSVGFATLSLYRKQQTIAA